MAKPVSYPDSSALQSDGAAAGTETLSAPLYIGAAIGMIAALAAVNSVLGIDVLGVTSTTLACLGFVFSYSCRWVGVPPRVINLIAALVTLFLLVRLITGGISIAALEPVTAGQGDLQLAVLLEWMAIISSWTLNDDRRVVMSSIVSVAIIGLVAAYDANTDLLIFFLIYVVSTIFLLIHQNYLLHRSWGKPDEGPMSVRLLSTQMALSLVCGVFVLFLGLVLVVPLQAVGLHLSLGSALSGLAFAGKAGNDTPVPGFTTTALSDQTSFPIGQGNADFSESLETVIRAYPSDHQEHYWRGCTYDQYTGQAWISTQSTADRVITIGVDPATGASVYPLPLTAADAGRARKTDQPLLSTMFEVGNSQTDTLYAPQMPVTAFVSPQVHDGIQISQDGHVGLTSSVANFTYRIDSQDSDASVLALRKETGANVPPLIQRLYIAQRGVNVLPEDSSRLAQQAISIVQALPPHEQDEYDRATAIRDWVGRDAKYALDVPATPAGTDSVSYFLFTSKVGYCDLYASSMAILCRYAGIPARVVTGFAPGSRRLDGGFDLRLKDKHAWCEVYFPHYGWYIFDPTSVTTDAPANRRQTFAGAIRALFQSIAHFFRTAGPIPVAVTLLLIGAIAYIVKTEVIDRFRRSRTLAGRGKRSGVHVYNSESASIARAAAAEHWRDACQALARWRLRQEPSETTREFVARVAAAVAAVEARRDADASPPPVSAGEAAEALSSLGESYLAGLYASDDDPLTELVRRNQDGSLDRELQLVRHYAVWGRSIARGLKTDTEHPTGLSPAALRERSDSEEAKDRTPAGV